MLSSSQIQQIQATVPILRQHGEALTGYFYQFAVKPRPLGRGGCQLEPVDAQALPHYEVGQYLSLRVHVPELGIAPEQIFSEVFGTGGIS